MKTTIPRLELRFHKIKNLLYIGLLLMIIKYSFGSSDIISYSGIVDDFITLSAIFCFLAHILMKRRSLKYVALCAALGSITLISTYLTGTTDVLFMVIIWLAVSTENLEQVICFIYKYELYYFVGQTILALVVGILTNDHLVKMISGVARANIGFNHPNKFSIYLFNLIMMWIWINYERIHASHLSVIAGIEFASYCLTRTRTSLIQVLLLIILLVWLKSKQKTSARQCINLIAYYIIPALTAMFVLFSMMYAREYPGLRALDNLFSGRIRLGAYAFTKFGFTFWGQWIDQYVVWEMEWGLDLFTFDNVYTFFCFSGGIFWLLIVIAAFHQLVKYNIEKINFSIIFFALYGVTEIYAINPFMCFPIMLPSLLLNRNIQAIKKTNKVAVKISANKRSRTNCHK